MTSSRGWRRLLAVVAVFAATLLASEAVSWIVFRVIEHDALSLAQMRVKQDQLATAAPGRPGPRREDAQSWMRESVLHPYLGFVDDPTDRSEINEMGFMGPSPLQHRKPGRKVVFLFGGSVAFFLGTSPAAKDALRSGLEKIWNDQEIALFDVALGGYKQPQQLIALAYLLSLGGEPDLVINLDGFNDVVLTATNNSDWGVFPFYPRAWNLYTVDATDLGQLRDIGRIVSLRDEQRSVAGWLRGSFLQHLVTPNVIWTFWNDRLESEASRLETRLAAANPRDSYLHTGPKRRYASDAERDADAAEVWKRSSLEMWHLSRSNGIEYFHFLQPNQYVPGSKPLSDWERAHALENGKGAYGRFAAKGYAFLQRDGAELAKTGMHFHDLTQIFAGHTETLYRDSCCHLNDDGQVAMAREIARLIAADLSK